MYLLDTNAISEVGKIHKNKANAGFARWFLTSHPKSLFLSDIVLLELRQGALLARHKGYCYSACVFNFVYISL